jgi:predicted nucleic acid-binding protein
VQAPRKRSVDRSIVVPPNVTAYYSVYDSLFFELAERENAPLVTYDQRLLKAWPAIACRPSEPGTR